MGGHLRPAPPGQPGNVEDYRVIISHSCTFLTIFIHMNGLAPEILEVTGEPRGGKIDYDIDGRLVGNWFLEGTVDYRGSGPLRFQNYWYGHLAIVYDYLDPTAIRISVGGLGDYGGMLFGVRGNTPDPADVTPASGLVKYELMGTSWVVAATGERWDQSRHPGSAIRAVSSDFRGTALVQMLGDRRIKMEVFLERAPDQVEGFTNGARIYER